MNTTDLATPVKSIQCEACGYAMSATSDEALAEAIGDHLLSTFTCLRLLEARAVLARAKQDAA
jgi:hypothetical protein